MKIIISLNFELIMKLRLVPGLGKLENALQSFASSITWDGLYVNECNIKYSLFLYQARVI